MGSPVYQHMQLTPRDYWNELVDGIFIENGLPYRRNVTRRVDHAQLRMGHAPQMLAVLNNTVLGLYARRRQTKSLYAKRMVFRGRVNKV
jgi:hypothetical protein